MTKPKAKAAVAPKKEVAAKKETPKKETPKKETPKKETPKKEVAVKKPTHPVASSVRATKEKHVTKRSIVFELAKQGLDIQQIVAKTGQPKSSVAWLFSKFQLYRNDDAKSLAMKAAKEAREAKKAAEQKPMSKAKAEKEAKKFIPMAAKAKVKPVKPAPTYVPFDAEEEESSPFANEE